MTYNPNSVSDGTLIEAVRDCYENGRHDLAGGGVHPSTLEDHEDIPLTKSTLRPRLKTIAESDAGLVEVHGISPESKKPRPSFLPSDACDEHSTE